jgi:hypothetical protein
MRGRPQSAAGPKLILLSPGVRPLSQEHQHAEFIHELGHVVQYALMPDGDARGWASYRSLRHIEDDGRFSSTSKHADRPHEIFAEDFRALFGGARATYSGTIENDEITPPQQVQGLEDFLFTLSGIDEFVGFAATPNPTRGPIQFALGHAALVPLDLFDASGRRIATVEPRAVWSGVEWTFCGQDDRGRRVGPGVLYARPRGTSNTMRVVVLP